MSACDYDLRIFSINPAHAGATHDSFIWRSSTTKSELERCYNEGDWNSWLLGESGFPLQPWLMVHFQNAAPNSPEDRFNQTHALTRNCIERCNRVLKTRFLCKGTLRYDPETVRNIVTAYAVMCIATNVELPPINNLNQKTGNI
ncbi:hypothetical protein NQ314_007144 [Rhamnusium bicolor]|uniref:DDE Tnp4 domain-containing protein n=1 Tax=Rhamnusium bicolor TaxID=1586634 RepID=A0AAV8YRA0_9CUCU|nr:hypothetical protein NQ314_007144 [Rhamnusium bicolor]